MATQPHVIEVEIGPDGQITGEVKGVTGPDCTTLSAWLDEIGKLTVDLHTADFHKPKNVITNRRNKVG